MLIYRIETCVSLFGTDIKVPAGLGPYGTRDAMRSELRRGTYEMYFTGERAEIEAYVRNHMMFLFFHKECNMQTHPAPTNDETLMKSFRDKGERPVIRGYNFGFKDVHQLKNWFNRDSRISLHFEGYYVAIYETEEAHVGDTQCVFMKDKAELVGFISCLEV